jgi:adenylate cyclase class 2
MQNVEYKSELRDLEVARGVCARMGATWVGKVVQRDTHFKMADGRLKRRETEGETSEWIFYHRADRVRPKLSHFTIYGEEAARRRFGTMPMPPWVTVEKTREIWVYQNARIHLDEVVGIGVFFEVEALVSARNHVGMCHNLVNEIVALFRPTLGEPVSVSYADLVAAEAV